MSAIRRNPDLPPIANVIIRLLYGFLLFTSALAVPVPPPPARPNQLPRHLYPEIYAWFWQESTDFQPEGYKAFVDMVAGRTNFNFLTASPRSPAREIADPAVHDQIRRGVEYARSKGLPVAFDLDVRLARGAFRQKHPGEMQWMLRLHEVTRPAGRKIAVESLALEDHMTAIGGSYERLSGKLARVYGVGPGGALSEITRPLGLRVLEESPSQVVVEFASHVRAPMVVVAAAFEYRTPDVFAPSLMDFQQALHEQYRDVPLAGALKDEWGFPPTSDFGAKNGNFWYSRFFDRAYRAAGGGDLIRDAVLMRFGYGGGYPQRIAAVNRYMRLILERVVETEKHYYQSSKRVFGKDAFTGTHATWGNMPWGDAFKNGYSWWQAPRDIGQTDEFWPLPVRTSLAKKMGSAVWFNQFYHRAPEPYADELWRAARNAGRMNVHPLWPAGLDAGAFLRLLQSPALEAARRIRLLNYISSAPLDCPVAVVFGHAAALNWVGPHFGDLGVDFAEDLSGRGARADVIPSSEIRTGALKIVDGWVTFGPQRYKALVFLNPEYEPAGTFEFLRRAALSSTRVYLRGRAHCTAEGAPQFPVRIPGVAEDPVPSQVIQWLTNWHSSRLAPPDMGVLTDGTCIIARGDRDPAGDSLNLVFSAVRRTCGPGPPASSPRASPERAICWRWPPRDYRGWRGARFG